MISTEKTSVISEVKRAAKHFAVSFAALAVILCGAGIMSPMEASASAIPNKGAIAIYVSGPSKRHVDSSYALITKKLLAKGYKVVDAAVRARIEKQILQGKVARAVLAGDGAAIKKLSAGNAFSVMIAVGIEADDEPEVNEFKLYTGTATASVNATSAAGAILYGGTGSAKQVGYTKGETSQKAIEAAVAKTIDEMLQ
ncbi:hypothetical protein FACS1894216_14500 [Synergistales bacterium]|nr:hypothetical protein FACS1894216_14500 [Synergistales bacterium]